MHARKRNRSGRGSSIISAKIIQTIIFGGAAMAAYGRKMPYLICFALCMLLAAGCATQLAPLYDQAIFDGLTATNKDVQTLFASLGASVTKESYAGRADTYTRIVGSLNALEMQAKARPLPSSNRIDEINTVLAKSGLTPLALDPQFSAFPSARAIHGASGTLQMMSNIDRQSGLRGDELRAFENQASTFLSQAIAYETFLKR
jgi:hypothetical protein